MYSKLKIRDKAGRRLKQHHHVNLGSEFRSDCDIWTIFLKNASAKVLCRPFLDIEAFVTSAELNFYTDASGKIRYGCFFDGRWTFGYWNKTFLLICKPSIEFLELYALCAGVLTWEKISSLNNTRVIIFCDNQAVVSMVNNTTSSCKNCMTLLRYLVLNNLKFNR